MHPNLLVPAATPSAAKNATAVETLRAWLLYCNVNCRVNINGNGIAVRP
jgi:hypothetical protein